MTYYINWPFAWIMKLCLMISGNYYWLALMFFALIFAVVLLPLAVKQQKSQIQSASFEPIKRAIQKKYKGLNDRVAQQKMAAEIQEEQQKAGINVFGGCMLLLPQMVLIFILYAIVRAPITYSFEFEGKLPDMYTQGIELVQSYKDAADSTSENYEKYIEELTKFQTSLGGTAKDPDDQSVNKVYIYGDKEPANGEYELLKLIKNEGTLNAIVEKYDVTIDSSLLKPGFSKEDSDKLPNFEFFGESLLDLPQSRGFSLLLLIPLLVFISQFGSTKISRMFMTQQLDVNGNPIGGGLFMEVGLPLMSAVFAYLSFSAAIGVYWIWRTVIQILQTVIINKVMPLPVFTEEEYAEAERKYRGKQKKKKKITIEVDEDDERYAQYIGSQSAKSEEKEQKYTYDRRVEILSADDDSVDSTYSDSDDEML